MFFSRAPKNDAPKDPYQILEDEIIKRLCIDGRRLLMAYQTMPLGQADHFLKEVRRDIKNNLVRIDETQARSRARFDGRRPLEREKDALNELQKNIEKAYKHVSAQLHQSNSPYEPDEQDGMATLYNPSDNVKEAAIKHAELYRAAQEDGKATGIAPPDPKLLMRPPGAIPNPMLLGSNTPPPTSPAKPGTGRVAPLSPNSQGPQNQPSGPIPQNPARDEDAIKTEVIESTRPATTAEQIYQVAVPDSLKQEANRPGLFERLWRLFRRLF